MSLFWKVLFVVVFCFAAVGVSALGIMISDRGEPIAYEDARALNPTVPQGGSLEVEFVVYRSRICSAVVTRRLTDSSGTIHNIPIYTIGPARGVGRESYRRSIQIPQDAAVGPATYEITIDFYCNALQRLGWPVTVASPPITFTITPAPSIVPFGLTMQDFSMAD